MAPTFESWRPYTIIYEYEDRQGKTVTGIFSNATYNPSQLTPS